MAMMSSIERLKWNVRQVVDDYFRPGLDCDGQSRLFSWAFEKRNVPHMVNWGIVYVDGNAFPIHYWISFNEHHLWVLDMKLTKWFSHPDTPHGLYNYMDQDLVEYKKLGVDKMKLSDDIAAALLAIHPAEVQNGIR